MSVQNDLELCKAEEREISWMVLLIESCTPFTAKYSSKKDLIVIKHPDTGKTVASLQVEDAAIWVDGVVTFKQLVSH